MRRKLAWAVTTAVAAFALAAPGVGSATVAHADTSVISVRCGSAALVAAMAGAGNGVTLSLAPLCSYKLAAALPGISRNLTILGNDATIARSFEPGTPDFTILTVSSGADVAVRNLVFRNGGSGRSPRPPTSLGGAIENDGNLTVTGGSFTGNSAAAGGAILNGSGRLSVRGAIFTLNSAADGGAILNEHGGLSVENTSLTLNSAANGGAIENDSTMTVDSSTFTGNTASRLGGAIATTNYATVTGSVFTRNKAFDAGGMFASATVIVTDSNFRLNTAKLSGGGIFNDGSMTLTDSQITRNTATSNGGGVYNDNFGSAAVAGTTFHWNQASIGGGMDNEDVVTLSGSQVSGNGAGVYGGGIYTDWVLSVTDSPIVYNSAANGGGGIYNGDSFGLFGTVTLTGSTVLYNKPNDCEGCQVAQRPLTAGRPASGARSHVWADSHGPLAQALAALRADQH